MKLASASRLPSVAVTPEKSASAHCLPGVAATVGILESSTPVKKWLSSIPKGPTRNAPLDVIGKCQHMRDMKALRAERSLRREEEKSNVPLRRAWNDRVVRHGDRLTAGDAGDDGKEEFTFVLQNQLTPDGV